MKERAKITIEVDIDVDYLAEQFAALSDDAQAQFLCKVAERLGETAASNQAYYIGRHLRNCECSTNAGRDFVGEIVDQMRRVTG